MLKYYFRNNTATIFVQRDEIPLFSGGPQLDSAGLVSSCELRYNGQPIDDTTRSTFDLTNKLIDENSEDRFFPDRTIYLRSNGSFDARGYSVFLPYEYSNMFFTKPARGFSLYNLFQIKNHPFSSYIRNGDQFPCGQSNLSLLERIMLEAWHINEIGNIIDKSTSNQQPLRFFTHPRYLVPCSTYFYRPTPAGQRGPFCSVFWTYIVPPTAEGSQDGKYVIDILQFPGTFGNPYGRATPYEQRIDVYVTYQAWWYSHFVPCGPGGLGHQLPAFFPPIFL